MKQKFLKKNGKRLANAIKKACAYARDHSGWWCAFRPDDLGRMIIEYAYGADKYDVLNALCPGIQGEVITYARGDIRHRKHRLGCDSIATYTTLLLLVVVVALLSGVW